jgi:5-methylcytosine-specific restriction endonuclease McrA
MPTKRCSKCQLEKPTSEFPTRPDAKDGLRNQCKDCRRATSRNTSRRWRRTHPKQHAQQLRRYRQRYPERTNLHSRIKHANHNARKLSAPGSLKATDIYAQREHQNDLCFWCSAPLTAYEIDHILPLARGGSNHPNNVVLACPTCNRRKGDNLPFSEWLPPNPLCPPDA